MNAPSTWPNPLELGAHRGRARPIEHSAIPHRNRAKDQLKGVHGRDIVAIRAERGGVGSIFVAHVRLETRSLEVRLRRPIVASDGTRELPRQRVAVADRTGMACPNTLRVFVGTGALSKYGPVDGTQGLWRIAAPFDHVRCTMNLHAGVQAAAR